MAQALGGRRKGPLSVDLQEVESALRELWRREAADSGAAVTRLRTLNLVVMAGEGKVSPAVHRLLDALPRRHPARVIVLATSADLRTREVAAGVEIHAGEGKDRQVASEQVTLTAAPDAAAYLSGAALLLIIPDLPTFLWWAMPGDPVEHPLFRELGQVADRVLIDTSRARRAVHVLRTVASLRDDPELTVTDLNWSRLYAWRELTAQFFDNPDLRDCLESIASVDVGFAGGEEAAGSVQSLLYLAWLAGRLGWQPTAARGHGSEREIWFDRRQGDLSARIGPRRQPGGGDLCEVSLSCGDQRPTEFIIRRTADLSSFETVVTIPGADDRRRLTRFDVPDEVELLIDELDSRRQDEVFVEALGVIAALPGRIEG